MCFNHRMIGSREHPLAWKFYRKYANIPIPLRSQEIVAVVNDEPMTFNVIKIELDNKTELGYKALEQMLRLKLIECDTKEHA